VSFAGARAVSLACHADGSNFSADGSNLPVPLALAPYACSVDYDPSFASMAWTMWYLEGLAYVSAYGCKLLL
jgi:hypothetical protein